jgi:hypothetical protein
MNDTDQDEVLLWASVKELKGVVSQDESQEVAKLAGDYLLGRPFALHKVCYGSQTPFHVNPRRLHCFERQLNTN